MAGFFDDTENTTSPVVDSFFDDTEAEALPEALPSDSDFVPGVKRGLQNLQAMSYGAGALAGSGLKKLGADSVGQKLQDVGMEGYRRNIEEAKQYPKKHSFKDIYTGETGVGGAVDWVQGTLGELAPSMVEAALGAAIGSAVAPGAGTAVGAFAGRTVLKKGIEKVVAQAMKQGVGKMTEAQVRKQVTKQALRKVGGKVGIGAAVLPMESGGNYASLFEEKGIDAPETALLFGALSTSLEFLGGNSKLVDTFVDALSKGAKGTAKKSAKEILSNIPQEAMQEGGQEVFSILNTVANTDEKLLTAENLEALVESMAAGAVGGGAGSVLSAMTNTGQDPDTGKTPQEIETDKRATNILTQDKAGINKSLARLNENIKENETLLEDYQALEKKAEESNTPQNEIIAKVLADNAQTKILINKINDGVKRNKQEILDQKKAEYDKLSPEEKAVKDVQDKLTAKKLVAEEKLAAEEKASAKAEGFASVDKMNEAYDEIFKEDLFMDVADDQIDVEDQTAARRRSHQYRKMRYSMMDKKANLESLEANRQSTPAETMQTFAEGGFTSIQTPEEQAVATKIKDREEIIQTTAAEIKQETDPKVRQKLYTDLWLQQGVRSAQQAAETFEEFDYIGEGDIINTNGKAYKVIAPLIKKLDSLPNPENYEIIENSHGFVGRLILGANPNVATSQEGFDPFIAPDGVQSADETSTFDDEQQVGEIPTVEDVAPTEIPAPETPPNADIPGTVVESDESAEVAETETPEETVISKTQLDIYKETFKAEYTAGNIEIPQYMMILDLISKKDVKALQLIRDALNNPNDPNIAQRTASFKAKGKADLERLIKMLGSQMYQGNLAEITIKEVVQNSFDAVKASLNAKGKKGIKNGKIDIITDPDNRIIAIRDNGQGMSKSVLLDAFLTVAGTDKTGMKEGDASGGFGMAKAAFLYGNEWIEVNTVKNGKRYSFKGTGSDIISKGIDIKTEKAGAHEHGTTIVIKVPEHVEVDGKQQYVWFPGNLHEISFFKQPLLNDHVEIRLQDEYLDPEMIDQLSDHSPDNYLWADDNFEPIKVGKHSDLSGYSKPTKITFDWGTAELYLGKDRVQSKYGMKHNILSAGVYQFEHPFEMKRFERIPYNVILNIFPTAAADAPSYPFNVRREGWKDNIKADIKSLDAYVKNIAIGIEAEGTVEQFKNIQSLPLIDIDDIGTDNVTLGDEFFKPPKKAKGDKKPVAPKAPSKITVQGGQVTGVSDKGKKVVLINTNEDQDGKTLDSSFNAEKEAPKAKDFLIETGIDDSKPIFHNNTTTDYFALAKQHGYSAETFFAEFGSLMLKVKDIFVGKGIFGYDILEDKDQSFFLGTSIDKGYHGVNLVVPFQSILVNPLAVKEKTLPGIVHGLYDTFVHEFAHIPQRNHEQGFSEEVAKLKTKLASDGTDLELRVALGRVIKKHKNLIELMRNEYEKSTTKNVAKPLNDTEKGHAVASRRAADGSDGSLESGNGEWSGAFQRGGQSREDSGVSAGNQTAGRDVNNFQVSENQRTTSKKLGLADIEKLFPGQQVIQDPDGKVSIQLKNGKGITFQNIQQVDNGMIKIALETGQMSKTGNILGVTVGSDVLLDENFADNKTLWHENKHVLDNLGMITKADDSMLNQELNKLRKLNKLEFALSKHVDPMMSMVENRANMFAQIMVNREQYRNTPLGKVIQRIMDFFQQMLSFGKQTVSGLAREVESGKIYERQVAGQTYNTTVPQAEVTADNWHSALENAVDSFKAKQAPGSQWKGMIKNFPGIKQEELEWIGLNEWLDEQQGKVTKDALITFIKENNVRLEEVVKADNTSVEDIDRQIKPYGYTIDVVYGETEIYTEEGVPTEFNDLPEEVQDILSDFEEATDKTSHSTYQLSRGENYKELIITLPPKQGIKEAEYSYDPEARTVKMNSPSNVYTHGHWDDIENPLVHVRFNERTDSYGNKVLFLEEVQSDWHQEGRKYGYTSDKPKNDLILEAKITDVMNTSKLKELADEYNSYSENAHFTGESDDVWDALMLEQDRLYNELDKITSESNRSGIKLRENYDGTWSANNTNENGQLEQVVAEGATPQEAFQAFENEFPYLGIVPNAPFKKSTQWSLLAMKRMVKYAAENGFDKIAWTTGQQQGDRYPGGTEQEQAERLFGMKEFYDKILPNTFNKEFNRGKWGKSKVEVIDIGFQTQAARDVNNGAKWMVTFTDGSIKMFYDYADVEAIRYDDNFQSSQAVNANNASEHIPINVLSLPITERMRSKALREGMAMFEVREPNEGQRLSEAEYASVYKQKNNLVKGLAQQARMKFSEVKLLADKALGSISTRLKNVDPELSQHLRWLDFNTSQKIIDVLKTAKPILDTTKSMTAEDKSAWNWARLNSDEGKIEALAQKYNLSEHLVGLREKLNKIRTDAIDVGYDVGFIDEYWPRVIKDQEGFLQATQGISERAVFTEAIRAQAKKLGLSQAQFEREFPEVKADIISNLILGTTSGIGGPGNIQSRVYETIPEEYAKFYMDADAALMQYVYSMTKKIEARRFFGKVPKRISDLKASKKKKQSELIKLEQLADMARAENPERLIEYEDRITKLNEDIVRIDEPLNEYKVQRNYTENIGTYIDDLRTEGRIQTKDEKMVRDILDARFHEHGTTGVVNAYKNLAYIDTMGSPISAITQIGDLAWAMYVGKVWTPSGFLNTGKNLVKAVSGNSDITKEDLGIERIAQEFADGTTLSKAVSKVFKVVGLEKIDSIGKEVLINNALAQYRSEAQANPEALANKIKPTFGNKSTDVVQEILAGNPSDNVKMLLYSKLLDFQPVALSEMPENYLDSGNFRVLYMLKTYTLKQFDVFRKEVVHNLKSDNAQDRVKGITNMIQLMALLTIANATADELKDFLMGRETKFSDNVIENFLTMGGASRYTRMQISREGFGSAVAQQVLPPMKFLNSASKDIFEGYNNYISGDTANFDHARIIDSIPVAGKLYYWHAGRGEKNKKSINEQEFNKAGKDARLMKKQIGNADNKAAFIQSNADRFKGMKIHENFSGALSRNQAVINKLEKLPSTENVQTRIGQLKSQREKILKKYFEISA